MNGKIVMEKTCTKKLCNNCKKSDYADFVYVCIGRFFVRELASIKMDYVTLIYGVNRLGQ